MIELLDVESIALLVVFHELEFVLIPKVVACCLIKDRAAYICLTFPHLVDNAIDVVDLQELVHFELSYVEQH